MKTLLGSCVCASLLLATASCSRDKAPINETWNCQESNLKDTFDIQSLFGDRYILALEETEKSRVGNIEKLAKVDSLLFVMDSRLAMRVFVFNATTGQFLNSIGRTGSGPGEYVNLNDFSVDTQRGIVAMLTARHTVIEYDYQGNYKGKKDVSFFADKMECQGGKYYFVCYDEGRGNLIVTDKDMHVTAEYLTNKKDEPVVVFWHPLQKMVDGTVTFFRYMSDTVYQLNDKDELSVRYKVDFGSRGVDREQVTQDNMAEMEETRRCCIFMCTENEHYAWIGFYDKGFEHESILDKETGKTVAYPFDNTRDSSLGFRKYAIQYAMPGMMATPVNSEDIREDLVRNKDCHRGDNPAVYFLVNK